MSKSKRDANRSVRSRTVALTRKQELADLHRRKDAVLAEEVSRRLMPAIEAEVTKQIEKLPQILAAFNRFLELTQQAASPPTPIPEEADVPQIITP